MTGINVEYVDHMGDDLRVANIARVSFNKWKEEFDQRDAKLIDYLANNEHTSPFRHTALTIRCKAPVFIARQLGKHQAGLSWNETSRRYVDDNIEFFIPDSWRSRPVDGIKQGSGVDVVSEMPRFSGRPSTPQEEYEGVLRVCQRLYDNMIKAGIAPEMVRMVLPQSMQVDWVWTGNLFAFFHVYRLRIEGHAQVEAQVFAKQLDEVCSKYFPYSWEALKNAQAN